MPKVLTNPQYSAAKGYNGFPLRSSIQFSSTLGQLLPVWWHYLQPGDKVNCSTKLVTRSQPLQSSAMVDIEEHLEWFFVPMQQIYKLFEQVFHGVDDVHSNMYDSSSIAEYYPHSHLGDIVYSLFSGSSTVYYDVFGLDKRASSIRLLQLLGYDIDPVLIDLRNNFTEEDLTGQGSVFNVARCLWSLLAYQRIYYSHYRLSDRQNNDPSAYNVDSFYDSPVITAGNILRKMTELHYRPIQKDFFHGGFVSPLIGSGNIGMLDSFNNGNTDFESSFFRQYLGSSDSYTQDFSGDTVTNPSNVSFANTTLSNLRQSFALEKLLEITRRAGKHIDAQTLAHFGVKVPEGIADEAYFLGRHDSKLQIGDVISTAGTDSDPLGQVVGKAYNYSGNRDVTGFEAKTHGVLMCIYSADVPIHYRPELCDRLNTYVSPMDFYHPEFDDLGMQPIFHYQGMCMYSHENQGQHDAANERNHVMDWNYRYWENKLKYSRTCGALAGSLSMWTVQRNGYYNPQEDASRFMGLSNYLVDPTFLDDIMLVNYNSYLDFEDVDADVPTWKIMTGWYEHLYGQDPLFHDLFVDVDLASKMSTYGLPSL